ncbi:MAG: M35 family metallo-endopeptidase [Pseudomonadota bacterium]
MRILILSCLLSSAGSLAAAQDFAIRGCSKPQEQVFTAALGTAKDLTLKAAVAVGDTQDYSRWFGEYSDGNAERVRATLKAVVTSLRSGAVTATCQDIDIAPCNDGAYAYVYPNDAYMVNLCPSFFNLPPLTALAPGTRRSDNGTLEGTLVHELSHFIAVADTDDHCYSRTECSQMARSDAALAIDNADSYQYFTEDVTYYARQPLANKPNNN